MRNIGTLLAAAALLAAAGCGRGDQPVETSEAPAAEPGARPATPAASASPAASPVPPASAARWHLQSSGDGTALVFPASGAAAIRLFCPAGGRQLLVNLPAARPIGSEERLSVGSGGEVVALVADTKGDRLRGGVSGTGAVPANLPALIAGPVSASYGNQVSGPHPAPPADLAERFVAACRDAGAPAPAPTGKPRGDHPCRVQEGKALDIAALRAVGTEPFWAAAVEGRCVTYSTPEDQKGTRVWARYTPGKGGGGTWAGSLGGQPFELVLSPQPGCSDGMSDRRYPLAASLRVGGERRRGCAHPGS
jgi:uncharacterized membrane protein